MKYFGSIILTLLVLLCSKQSVAQKKVVCYWGTWAVYRPGNGRYDTSNINPHICTHIIYSFFGVTAQGGITYLDRNADLEANYGKGLIKRFIALKDTNPNVKLMAAVGGWSMGSSVFSKIAASDSIRKIFATNVLNFLNQWDFDGFDLDWEYPAQRDGNRSIDKANFVLLLTELKAKLSAANKLLTIAVLAPSTGASISYDIPQIHPKVDFINLMSYDLHGPWDGITGMNAPLYSGKNDTTPYQKSLNVDSCVKYWQRQGVPNEKLVIGIPLYGKSFTLNDASVNYVGAPTVGPGTPGRYTSPEEGFLGYNEICENKWTKSFDAQQQVPYSVKDDQWVSYDDIDSIAIKCNYVLDHDLAGVMVWSIETDDFRGICGNGRYPLITTIYTMMSIVREPDEIEPDTTTDLTIQSSTSSMTQSTISSMTQSTTSSMTQSISSEPVTPPSPETTTTVKIQCESALGMQPYPGDCNKYIYCSFNVPYVQSCPHGLYFDPLSRICNYPHLVDCN